MKARFLGILTASFIFAFAAGSQINARPVEATCYEEVDCVPIGCHYDVGAGYWWRLDVVDKGSQSCETAVRVLGPYGCGRKLVDSSLEACESDDAAYAGRIGAKTIMNLSC